MRAWSITITDTNGQLWIPPSMAALNTGQSYTSLYNGVPLAGALNVEWDIQVQTYAQPAGGSFIEISGIPITEISQGQNLNGFGITVAGGMVQGLPLATADFQQGQYGILVQGSIYQAFANWEGLDQRLDIILQPPTGSFDEPRNLILNWPAGTPMSTAINQALSTAFPGYSITMNINQNLVLQQDQWGVHYTLGQFARYIEAASKAIIGSPVYTGVTISIIGTKIIVDDGTATQYPKGINYYDLLGQPTWLDDGTIQLKTNMRADINQADWIAMPQTPTVQGYNAPGPFTNKQSTFQGNFQVKGLRHVANSREADPSNWATIIDCYTTPVNANG